MLIVINFIALYAAFSQDHTHALYWGAVLPTLYAIVAAPHALIGSTALPRAKITTILEERWNNVEELTDYIAKYWMALSYPTTSWKKQRNSIILYLTSFVLGVVYFLKEMFMAGFWMFLVAYVLYQMSLRVDRPRSVYTNSDFRDGSDSALARKEWELAAMAVVAFSDLYPDNRAVRDAANEVSSNSEVQLLLKKHRIPNGGEKP
jgi:hypothetical protein